MLGGKSADDVTMLKSFRDARRRATQQAIDAFDNTKLESIDAGPGFQEQLDRVQGLRASLVDMVTYLTSAKAGLDSMVVASTAMADIMDDVAVGMSDRLEFKTVMSNMAGASQASFNAKIDAQIASIGDKLNKFDDLRDAVDERKRLLLDVKAYTRRVRYIDENPDKVDPEVEHRRRGKLEASMKAFEWKDAQTRGALAYLDSFGARIGEAEGEAFKIAYVVFFEDAIRSHADLQYRDVDEVRDGLEAKAEASRVAVVDAGPARAPVTSWRSSMASEADAFVDAPAFTPTSRQVDAYGEPDGASQPHMTLPASLGGGGGHGDETSGALRSSEGSWDPSEAYVSPSWAATGIGRDSASSRGEPELSLPTTPSPAFDAVQLAELMPKPPPPPPKVSHAVGVEEAPAPEPVAV